MPSFINLLIEDLANDLKRWHGRVKSGEQMPNAITDYYVGVIQMIADHLNVTILECFKILKFDNPTEEYAKELLRQNGVKIS